MIRDPIFALLKRKYYFCHIGNVIAKGILYEKPCDKECWTNKECES